MYGSTRGALADETTPLNPPKLVAPRPAIERMVLESGDVRGVVLRPGCVYGYQGGLTGMWFAGAVSEKSLKAVGDGRNRWAMVHADDLADAYLRAGESGLAGEVFNITDRSRASVREMLAAVAGATGYQGEIRFVPVAEAAAKMGAFRRVPRPGPARRRPQSRAPSGMAAAARGFRGRGGELLAVLAGGPIGRARRREAVGRTRLTPGFRG